MLDRLRRTHPGSSIAKIISWRIAQFSCEVALRLIYGLRVRNAASVPAEGPVLIAANHQSFLDPPAIGCAVTQRQLDFVARGGLFENRHFGWFISFLNSIPVAEEGPDAAAIREILRRLEMGRCVMIFPEGSRTPDGEVHEFKRGVALLVKRAKCPVVPAAIDGAFEAWPRTRKRPRVIGAPRVRAIYGEAIYDELMKDGADAGLARIEREVRALHGVLKAER
jgi:1-acyl-sn-glycerol-3-phosphate acyltransferase